MIIPYFFDLSRSMSYTRIMKKDIRKQYNSVAEEFSKNHNIGENSNDKNRLHFYSFLDFPFRNKSLLDLACGDGLDANNYSNKGALVSGIDASEAMIDIAKKKYPHIDFKVGLAEKLPYKDNSFDVVTSKYSIMTSSDMFPIFAEVHRVLKPRGIFIYLVTHPFRQYFEKCSESADYFHQEIVTSNILNDTISLKEPSHTFNEYYSPEVLSNFDIIKYEEAFDPAAERINGRVYPGYFIITCQKRV